MYKKIEKYKELTIDIINNIGIGEEYQNKITILLEDRQAILDSLLSSEELTEFRILYRENDIITLDNELRDLLTKELNQAKEDILNQKKKKIANSAYSKIDREGFNVFSTQI